MDRRASRFLPSGVSAAVVLVGLLLALAVALAAAAAHRENEERILRRRTKEAAAVLQAATPGVESPLATAAAVAEAVDGDPRALRSALVGLTFDDDGPFTTVSVWSLEGPEPRRVFGSTPALDRATDDGGRSFIARTARTPDQMTVLDLVDGVIPTLGYAHTPRAEEPRFLVYAERALPEDRTAVVQQDSSFSGLDYTVHLDGETLLIASTDDVPLDEPRASEPIPFGDRELVITTTPTEPLGGTLLARLPLIAFASGAVTALGAGALTERLQRRRRHAEELAQENAALYAEQRAGSYLLQQSLLPARLPEPEGFEVAVRYEAGVAGTHVGGDWYDVVDREDGVVLVVGDVSGRGLAAASVMASIRHTARTLAATGLGPAEILESTNRIGHGEHDGHFATVVCAVFDRPSSTLTFASAGHPPPLLAHDGRASWLDVRVGPPIGANAAARYETASVPVAAGSTILLVTDGLFERRGEIIDAGRERLRDAVAGIEAPLPDLVDQLVGRLLDGPAADDSAVLAVRWQP